MQKFGNSEIQKFWYYYISFFQMSAVPEIWNQTKAINKKYNTYCIKCVCTRLQSVHTHTKI